jgi:hypothetical protein
MEKGAVSSPARYHEIIARRLWSTAGLSAAYNDWENADRAAALALQIAPSMPVPGGIIMRIAARHFPRAALRAREKLIRLFRRSARAAEVYHRPPAIKPGT